MPDEEKPEENVKAVWAGEIADAIKNGLNNEFDEGSWGTDLREDEDPVYEDVLVDTVLEAVIRLTVGQQVFTITVKEEPPSAEAKRGPDPK